MNHAADSAEWRKLNVVECRDYKSLNDVLIRIDYSHEVVRAICTGIAGPLPYHDMVAAMPVRHRSVVSKQQVARRLSLFRRKSVGAHARVSVVESLEIEHVGNTPVLHMFSSNVNWWQKVVKKRTLARHRVEALQHILKWLRSKPDHDLQGCEMLCNELQKFPLSTSIESVIHEEIIACCKSNSLELRARFASRLFTQAYVAVMDRTVPISWDVLCEEHEATVIARPASQVKRPLISPPSPTRDDSIHRVVEGLHVLVDPSKKEDQMKRLIDAIEWFGRAVKNMTSNVTGVASSIYDPHIRASSEFDVQCAIDTLGGLKVFNDQLREHGIEPLPNLRALVRETRRRRAFLEKCREGLVNLMVDCLSILGNLVPLSSLENRPSSFNVSSTASLHRSLEVETFPLETQSTTADTTVAEKGDEDDDPVDETLYPSWWFDFTHSPLHRKNLYVVYVNSIQRANAIRRAERDRLSRTDSFNNMTLPFLPILGEDEWVEETKRKIVAQARLKQHNHQHRSTTGESEVPRDDSISGGGSLDNLRPTAIRIGLPNGLAATSMDSEPVSFPHFLNLYLDKERQGYLPCSEARVPSILTLTRQEFAVLYQRCQRLRDVCTGTIETCSQAISRLATIERVLKQ